MTWLRQETTSTTIRPLKQETHKTSLPRHQIPTADSTAIIHFSGLRCTQYTISYINSSDDAQNQPIQKISFNTPGVAGGPTIIITLNNRDNVGRLFDLCQSEGFRLLGRESWKDFYLVVNFRSERTIETDTFDRFKELFDIFCQFDRHINSLSDMILSDVSRLTGFDFTIPQSAVSPARPTFFQSRAIARADDIPDEFLCPISKSLMENPVILTLDGRNYERKNITMWLNARQNSPFTRAEIPFGKTIEEVLVPNITLAEAIEEFKEANYGLFDERTGPR